MQSPTQKESLDIGNDAVEDTVGESIIQSISLTFIIATIPLLFGAVQPEVWAVYAAFMICVFLLEWWRNKIDADFKRSPLLLLSAGVFLAFTLAQMMPLPQGLLGQLSPYRHQVLGKAAGLLGLAVSPQPLSYRWQVSFAWWIFLAGLFLFACVFRAYAGKKRNIMMIVAVMFGLAVIQSVYGLVQALIPTLGVLWADVPSGLGDARGTFINRNHFAGYLEMVWPLGLGLILALSHIWSREGGHRAGGVRRLKNFLSSDRVGLQLLLWGALVFVLLALIFSKSRAGITGAFVGFAAYVILVHAGKERFSWPAWAVMGAGFAFLLFYGNVIGFDEVIGRFLLVDEQGGSRIDIWSSTMAMVRDHPFGIGLGNFEAVMPIYNSNGPYGIKYTHAHNDYLQLLAEAGWPGFLAIVGGFYLFLYKECAPDSEIRAGDGSPAVFCGDRRRKRSDIHCLSQLL